MESKDYDLVKQEVELVISTLNNNQVLSIQDEIEIEDHFFCDVEELCTNGLNTKEALLVARSRFGALEGIKEDYEAIRPENSILQFTFIAILLFSVSKMIINVISLLAETFWLGKLYLGFGKEYLYLDLPIRFILFGFCAFRILKFIQKKDNLDLKQFWYLPILYLLSEIISRAASFIFLPGVVYNKHMEDMLVYAQIWDGHTVFLFGLGFVAAVFTSFKLRAMKKEEHQYV